MGKRVEKINNDSSLSEIKKEALTNKLAYCVFYQSCFGCGNKRFGGMEFPPNINYGGSRSQLKTVEVPVIDFKKPKK
jgi:hypothetical protein